MREQRILSIDYGKKRIGLALSDPLFTFAYSFKTLINDKNLWKNIAEIIKEKKVAKVILGLPNEIKNKSLANIISNFKKEIEKRFKLEVITWDEEYTSAIAQERIIESVTKKNKRRDKGLIDRNSAAVILQEYLDGL
ncbi:MAG: Holliday junction resolvase RuvX [Ignavibacteriaceae bacterium]|jgi:putative Holliday junction resolvase